MSVVAQVREAEQGHLESRLLALEQAVKAARGELLGCTAERGNLEHSLADDVREEELHAEAANHEAQLLKEHLDELASANEKLRFKILTLSTYSCTTVQL